MNTNRLILIASVIGLFFAASLQSSGLLAIGGIKPNLVLVLLTLFTFFIPSFFLYCMLVLCAALFINFSSDISRDTLALIGVALLIFYARIRFITGSIFTAIACVTVGTLLFYLVAAPAFLYHNRGVVIGEFIYNGVFTAILFILGKYFYEKKNRSSI